MKVLFIGGTGVISSACSQMAVDRGIELYLLNRGQTKRPVPKGAHILIGDIRDQDSIITFLKNINFDVVVNWIAYTPDHIKNDLDLFTNRTQQYLFISSASAYQTPPAQLPVTESTPLANPYWDYSRAKIACENMLVKAYRTDGFPVTIVRPSHTYDRTKLPMHGGYTIVDRMRKNKKVVVHGDGSSIWILTHHLDFARGFTGLLGNSNAIGESFHITSDEYLTWNQIFEIVARAAGGEADIVHIPSDWIATRDEEWGAGLLGDKAHSMIFDNTKIKRVVPEFEANIPFRQGAEEILRWYDSDPSRQIIDTKLNEQLDHMIAAFGSL